MELIVHEMTGDTLSQKITVGSSNKFLYAVRPHILKYGNPSGSLYFLIADSAGKAIFSSDLITISSISASDYFHGYVRFLVSLGLRASTTYTFQLIGSGYTFSESAYIGWCNDYDLRKYDTDYSSAPSPADGALDMEIWTRELVEKGVY